MKVKHIMQDGRVLASLEGVVIPRTNRTAGAYEAIREIAERSRDEKNVTGGTETNSA